MNDSFLVRPSYVPAGVCALHGGFSICDQHSNFTERNKNPPKEKISSREIKSYRENLSGFLKSKKFNA